MESGEPNRYLKNRRIILDSGEHEKEDQSKIREREAAEKYRARATENPELSKIIEQIDFKVLKAIFEETAQKCGVDPRTLNFVESDRIMHASMRICGGSYSAYDNLIGLTHETLKERAEKLGVDLGLFVLSVVCHEETHATARIECYRPWLETLDEKSVKLGYQRASLKTHKFFFSLFNEGVTEKFSREVFREYVHRTGMRDKEGIAAIERAFQTDQIFYYGLPVKFVDALTLKIAYEASVDDDVVWRAIIRGMYEGEDLENSELKDFFSEIIGPNFIDSLATAEEDNLEALLKTLALPVSASPLPQTIKERVMSWLKRML